ncbi:hypothetical protein N0V88_004618 [Collariella sp. IMI 366227]|nr:hypothetical protein N0V88_004618 [Collariella sp. IMI 366227]
MANPLDAGTELFRHYDTEFQLVQADLVDKLEQATGIRWAWKKNKTPSTQRSGLNKRIRDYQTDVDNYKRRLKSLAEDRSALFGGRYTDDPSTSAADVHYEQRQQLLSGTDRLDRSTQRLKASQALANETEALGANTLAQLQQQREQIDHTTRVLYESEGYVDRSVKSLKGIAHQKAGSGHAHTMEPPSKRPRFGPSPFPHHAAHNDDDPEADELNERPEDVNARRDPAAKFERSRAFAAFKLKSAFERIFEKYEKDLSGVSDEIDLRTGEIVVDNGHIQSLKAAHWGRVGKRKMLRGREEGLRLSRLALPPAMPSQIATGPFFGEGWPAQPTVFPRQPGFGGGMYPGQMQSGGYLMQYGMQTPVPTTDPTWAAPELPPPFLRNALTASGEAAAPIRKKAARLSLDAARQQDGDADDDIFLDVSGRDKPKSEVVAIKRKVLLPRPPPEKIIKKKQKRVGLGTELLNKAKELEKHTKTPKVPLAGKKKVSKRTPTVESDNTTLGRTLGKPTSRAKGDAMGIETAPERFGQPLKATSEPAVTITFSPERVYQGNTKEHALRDKEPTVVDPLPPAEHDADSAPDPEKSDFYINFSNGERN